MGTTYTPIGRAVAIAKGHYPTGDGRHASIKAGETFTVFDGLDKASWFKLIEPGYPALAVAEPAPPPAEPDTLSAVAKVERKRKAEVNPPTGEDPA